MINSMQKALIQKDIRAITSNKRLFSVLLIVPLVMIVFLPSVFILMVKFFPEDSDLEAMLLMLPEELRNGDLGSVLVGLLVNNIMPLFFLLIPIMAASVMAANSFVGEREKHTLETLLYCPLPLKQIYQAKILASFILSMMVSLLSFLIMLAVVEAESWFAIGALITPSVNWLIMLALVSPAVTVIAITLIVRGSAKAQSVEESQQKSVFLVVPVILLAVSQFTGLMLINGWILAGIGIVLAVAAFFLMSKSFKGNHYETLLKP
jgi:ABC-type Na+ efflux pump permease subunit